MPNINEMMPSKFLKITDVPDPVIVTVLGVKQMNVAREDQEPEYKWAIKFKEFSKPMVLNSTNLNTAARVFGSMNTDDWNGKEIVLYNDENVSYAGKQTGGLRFRGQDKAPVRRESENPNPFEAKAGDLDW